MPGNRQRPVRRAHRMGTTVVRAADLASMCPDILFTAIDCSRPAGGKAFAPGSRAVLAPSESPASYAHQTGSEPTGSLHSPGALHNTQCGSLGTNEATAAQELGSRGYGSVREYVRRFEAPAAPALQEAVRQNPIRERSANFSELLEAFHMLEKRPSEDATSRVLKKFRTNEECPEDGATRVALDIGMFPKIQNNPFIRWEAEAGMRPLYEERAAQGSPQRSQRRQRRSSLRTNPSNSEK